MKTKQITALEKAIKESGLKQVAILDRSGLSYMRLYALRQGRTVPTLIEANSLATLFSKSTEELFPKEK